MRFIELVNSTLHMMIIFGFDKMSTADYAFILSLIGPTKILPDNIVKFVIIWTKKSP